jgi:hypothetical protein
MLSENSYVKRRNIVEIETPKLQRDKYRSEYAQL